MLRALHSALKPDGRLGLYVIATSEAITETDRALLARRDGNDHVEAPLPYDEMLSQAGFVDIDLTDVSAEFVNTLAGWKREWEAEADSLIEVFGEAEFTRKLENRRLDIAHTEAGLLRRYRVYGVNT